ncbi:MAG TPA: hypothetical protein VK822_20460 [Acetobacteraceae bacterium]|jgi:hypothetical protein|nr:hypothetical protein [Acetobacteraceae bacterium]
MNNQMTENQITDTPTELDDRDLDLVAGGWGGGVSYNQGNTSQFGLLNVSALNGNNILSLVGL